MIVLAMRLKCQSAVERGQVLFWGKIIVYHKQGPEGVVEEDDRGGHKHGDAHEFVKLRTWERATLAHVNST